MDLFNFKVSIWDSFGIMRYQQKRPENGVSLISKTPNYVGRHAIDTSLYHFEAL